VSSGNGQGVSTKTIRYYEDIGLVPPAPRLASGYRDYEPSMLDRLALIMIPGGSAMVGPT
jgi:DNA-binding transcriptional MerR regulator